MSGSGYKTGAELQAKRDTIAGQMRADGAPQARLVRQGRTESGVVVRWDVDEDGSDHVLLCRGTGGKPRWHTIKGFRLAFWPGVPWSDVGREDLADGTVHLSWPAPCGAPLQTGAAGGSDGNDDE